MSGLFEVHRYHDISCGHRVCGHECKCQYLHGHNYRVHFTCVADMEALRKNPFGIEEANNAFLDQLDDIGRVIDFSEVKSRLCMWLEDNWDHHFLVWENDPIAMDLVKIDSSTVLVPFNPTAENMAQYLVEVIGPQQLEGTFIRLVKVTVEETRKCFASYGV